MSGVNTLKELREQRRIDINYVAREINISPAILEKIEAEQFREIGAPSRWWKAATSATAQS